MKMLPLKANYNNGELTFENGIKPPKGQYDVIVIFPENNEIISDDTISEIKDKIIQYENPDKIILHGSYARGDASKYCDLDLIVIKETNISLIERGHDLRWELADYPFEVDLKILTKEEFERWKERNCSYTKTDINKWKVLYEK